MDSPTSPRTPKSCSLSAELKEIIDKRNMLTTRTRMKVLNALDELHQQNTSEKVKSLRAQTIQEILNSEIKYLRQLEIIMEYFMKPILERKFLDYDSYTILFENIETLYNVNGELLKELEKNPENVAQAFCKLAPFLKLYSVYAYNYKRALELLQEIQQNDASTSQFISNQETRPEVSCKLSSLLIAPIQRVPRYKLLLQQILRHTTPKEKDYNELQASLVQIEKVASHINSLVADYEDTQKLLELQKHIVGPINLIKPGRKLIRQGPLMRVSRKGNSSFRRHFVLLSDTLLYCKGDPDNSLTICCLLPLNKCKVERVLSNGLFKVACMHENLLLYSENGDSKVWIQVLNEAVKKYVECRQTLRKDSSSRIPMRRISRLQEDSITEKRSKRKRPLSTNDAADEALSNNSNIIYINRDVESETASEGSSFKLALKRFKRSSVELDPSVNLRFKSWIDRVKRKDTNETNDETQVDNNFFHHTKNTTVKPTNIHENRSAISTINNDETVNLNSMNYSPINLEPEPKENNQPILSLKNVSKFFTNIASTVRDLISRNQ